MNNQIIGVDFDNTVIIYDELFYRLALEHKLISPDTKRSKRHIRDFIRQAYGDIEWQRLQAEAYGTRLHEASLAEHVTDFFAVCQENGVGLYIVSHKTKNPSLGNTEIDLREKALSWMEFNCLFTRFGLSRANVYFESTRVEKIERIKQLGCTHFIDDLEEVFCEESFPRNVEKILYSSNKQSCSMDGIVVAKSWNDIIHYLFK